MKNKFAAVLFTVPACLLMLEIEFHGVYALHIPKFDRRNQNIIVKTRYVIDKDGWRFAYLRLMAEISPRLSAFFGIGSVGPGEVPEL